MFVQDDPFCGSGYHHGVMEAITAEIGGDRILEEADTGITSVSWTSSIYATATPSMVASS
jgi:hypothetical protein